MNFWLHELRTLPSVASQLSTMRKLPAGARVAKDASLRIRGQALALLRQDGPQRIGALAERLGITRESMRGHLVQMAAEGQVERRGAKHAPWMACDV